MTKEKNYIITDSLFNLIHYARLAGRSWEDVAYIANYFYISPEYKGVWNRKSISIAYCNYIEENSSKLPQEIIQQTEKLNTFRKAAHKKEVIPEHWFSELHTRSDKKEPIKRERVLAIRERIYAKYGNKKAKTTLPPPMLPTYTTRRVKETPSSNDYTLPNDVMSNLYSTTFGNKVVFDLLMLLDRVERDWGQGYPSAFKKNKMYHLLLGIDLNASEYATKKDTITEFIEKEVLFFLQRIPSDKYYWEDNIWYRRYPSLLVLTYIVHRRYNTCAIMTLSQRSVWLVLEDSIATILMKYHKEE